MGVLSFNGNKIVTTGGGGAILTNDPALAEKLKFLSTTAKQPHAWEYRHDELGFNYRLPGLNAALGCGQMERLEAMLKDKREIATHYQQYCESQAFDFLAEPVHCHSNYWLNTLILDNEDQRDDFLAYTNQQGIMTRPLWEPMHFHQRFSSPPNPNLGVCEALSKRVVNIPSSPRIGSI